MNYEDVQKVSNAAKAKSNLVNTNFFKYFIRAIMAGFFIDVAMIYSNVVGNVFSKTMPEWGKICGGISILHCSASDQLRRRRTFYRKQYGNGVRSL